MKKNITWKRGFAALLAVVLLLGNFPGITVPASAETVVYGGLGTKTADGATVNNWKNYIGQKPDGSYDTSLAGGVWTDKSVFETAQDYFAATAEEEEFELTLDNPRSFLLSLSAMASTKTIVGYSTLPTDTVFILDVSGSMNDSSNRDARMVDAANRAIGELLDLNNYNRVGVVLYSGSSERGNSNTNTATVLMPLDRYTTGSVTNDGTDSYIYLSNDSVGVSEGVRNSDDGRLTRSKRVVGGTYIQNGIYKAMLELTDPNLDTVITDGFQNGTSRTPIMVLMSDGEPTAATNAYTNIGTSNMGDGTTNNATPDIAFVTQLTAAWAKEKVAQKYGDEVEPLFYTLGLGVGNNANALSVMDPLNTGASRKANEYWEEFEALAEGGRLNLDNHNNRSVTKLNDGVRDGTDNLPLSRNYVDRYFPASSSNDLSKAFQSIVETIILQTMYYPTLVDGGDVHHSGYMDFSDYIGPNMEVKSVKGVQLGDTLYTGERLAHLAATGMGTEQNPTEAGNELVRSVVTRLGMGEIGDPVTGQKARELLEKAWAAGHLAYHEDYDGNITWSNQICWYADEEGNYIKFWDGEGYEDADGAAFAIRSYGFLGEVGEGHRETDTLYATFQVRTALNPDGSVIEDIVHVKLPASLIPMVEYNVELDSNDPRTATEISMNVTGAEAPIRLLYEVGLREEIDLLDLEGSAVEDLRQDADGNFIFYTNQWDEAGLEAGMAPNKLHNAFVTFQPSEENERYYYYEDTPIYVKNDRGDFVRYSGAKPAAGDGNTYYSHNAVYTAASADGRATYTGDYVIIPAQALAADSVIAVSGTNNWLVKKGTLKLYETRQAVAKETEDHQTDTLPYSEYPIVHADAPGGYHLDGILGNNGLLTVNPPEGLQITKQVDDTIVDEGQMYTFTVELTHAAVSHENAEIYLVTERDGVRSSWQQIDFTDSYTVELSIGDSAWLAGLPEGNTYTVTETVDGEFEVSSITVDGDEVDEAAVTVAKGHMTDVEFTNSAVFTGDIVISKTVVSSFAAHETVDYAFGFAVEISGAEEDTTYAATHVAADGTQTNADPVITDGDGSASVQISLSHGEKWLLNDLPEGASVTAVETALPGFTCDQPNNTASADVAVGETTVISFTNTYEAEPVSPAGKVDLYVEKILSGDRDWVEGDEFTFVLEKHVSKDEHEVIEKVTVGYDDDDKIADFQSNVNDLFDAPGTYSYRITEETGDLPGVAYDTAVCYFDIVVEDDGEGKLYIADVIGRQDVTVIPDAQNGTWDVTAAFTNVYNSNGAVQISLSVTKDVEDEAETGINKSRFVFELYHTDETFRIDGPAAAEVETNAEGVAAFHDTIVTEEGTYYFVLKEAEGTVPGMEYDLDTQYRGTVTVTSNPETAGLVATLTVVDADGDEVCSDEVEYVPGTAGETAEIPTMEFAAEFTNVYTPDSAEAVITGTKVLNGRELVKGEFTFELFEADLTDDGFVVGDSTGETAVNADDSFTFENIDCLTFDKTGYYYFAVKEHAGDLGGVTYDETELFVTVHVTADTENGKLVVNSVNATDAQGVSKALSFTNTYVPAPAQQTLTATKAMTGRELAAGMFQFYLYETDDTYAVSGEPVQTVQNAADGSVSFDLTYNTVGEHYYVIAERMPAYAENGKFHGVTYDENQYRVQVVVRDNLDGQLVTEVSYLDGDAEFVNDYTPEPVTAAIGGVKTLSGRDMLAGDVFTMSLYRTDAAFGNPVWVQDTNVYADADGNLVFAFDSVEYSEAGGYRYIITEKNNGDSQIAYDGSIFYVIVNVADDTRGNLTAEVVYGNAASNGAITSKIKEVEFYNVFTHYPAELTLTGEKTLKDHAWKHDGKNHDFVFELYSANEEFEVTAGETPELARTNSENTGSEGKFSFPKMEFNQAGTYYFVVREQLPAGATAEAPRDPDTGIIYDVTENHVTVTVAEDPADPLRLKATYEVKGKDGITFTNEYSVEDQVFVPIEGKKIMDGRALHAEGFTFVLKDAAGNVLQTVRNTADGTSSEGTFAFQPLHFVDDGIYTYTVAEQIPAEADKLPGVTYDETVYTVTVEIGHHEGSFTDPVVTYRKGNEAANGIVFTNRYKGTASEPLVLEGTKVLHGGIMKDIFSFELYEAKEEADGTFAPVGAALETVTNAGTKISFTGISYDEVGSYHYIVKETAGTETGYTYDDNEFYVTVVVEDFGDGQMQARVDRVVAKETTDGVGIVFVNTYTPDPVPLVLSGSKTLSGRALHDGEFTFELYATGADHIVPEGTLPVDTAANTGKEFAFDEILLDKVGSYYYVVKEQKGDLAHVTYDSTVFHITVHVSNADGVLETEVLYSAGGQTKNGIEFINTYRKPDPQPDDLDVTIDVEKVLRGEDYRYGLEGFEFELVDADGELVDTAVSDRRGEATLDVGTFKKKDAGKTFTYYLYEVDTDIDGMQYSTREYKVQITVLYDSARNKLSYELIKDGEEVERDEPFVFTNVYAPGGGRDPYDPVKPSDPYIPSSPHTADEGLGTWITMLCISGLGLAAVLFVMLRRKKA